MSLHPKWYIVATLTALISLPAAVNAAGRGGGGGGGSRGGGGGGGSRGGGGGGGFRGGGGGGGGGYRGGGGGGGGYRGGGMPNYGGGGMARPSMPMNRPSMPMNRPSMPMYRPAMPMNRPAMNPSAGMYGNMGRPNLGTQARPSMPMNRPAINSFAGAAPGGLNRPNLGGIFPGAGGYRPTTYPGNLAGNRPGLGGNLAGAGGYRPTPNSGNFAANRPGLNSNVQGFAGNSPGNLGARTNNSLGQGYMGANNNYGGGRWGLGNQGGRTVFNNNNTNINNNNNVVNRNWGGGYGGGGYGGGGYYGGYGNGYGRGYGGGYYGGYQPYYGNWYRGNWGGNSFLSGFGLGALTSFGLSGLYGGYGGGYGGYGGGYGGYGGGYGGYGGGYGGYGGGYGSGYSSYFPMWSAGNYNSWGIGSVANSWLYSGYSNPYYTTVAAADPVVAGSAIYDYSQPLNLTAAPPETTVVDSAEQIFAAARDSFKAGDYPRALEQADQVLKQTANAPVVHEFRALALFAMKRYDEAAAVEYAVLSAGPGWNWPTLVGLYPNVQIYTDQLRALEGYTRSNPASAAAQFLLADHYLVQGHAEAARLTFEKVARLQPGDSLSASFVKSLTKVEAPAATPLAGARPGQGVSPLPAPAVAPATLQVPAQPAEAPPPPPAALNGIWTARPSSDVTILLTIKENGTFSWSVDTKGKKTNLEGTATFKDGVLSLLQPDGPPLVGKVTQEGPGTFVFVPPGAEAGKAAGLTFTK